MERKGSGTVAVTADEVKAALKRSKVLTAEEEKALRMRHGVGAEDPSAPLPRAAGGNEALEDELVFMQLQLMRAMKERTTPRARALPTSAPRNATKDKIVRALRKKS